MKNPPNKKDVLEQKNDVLDSLNNLLNHMIENGDVSTASKLNYWLKSYCNYLSYEHSFNPEHLKTYKRGEIVKADLGFNIGNEEGGLHFCIVLDKRNSIKSGVLTVIPLTSLKPKKDISHLKPWEVFLGTEIRDALQNRIDEQRTGYEEMKEKIAFLTRTTNFDDTILLDPNPETVSQAYEAISDYYFIMKDYEDNMPSINSMQYELNKMKAGSIALIGQITTISKMRIYDPRKENDVFSGVRISNKSLDKIDNAIKKLYIKS